MATWMLHLLSGVFFKEWSGEMVREVQMGWDSENPVPDELCRVNWDLEDPIPVLRVERNKDLQVRQKRHRQTPHLKKSEGP